MKRKYFYLMALAALTLGACSNENDLFGEDPNGGPEGQKQEVTFLFPGTAQGVVPYAPGDPIASEEENKIATLDVYVFGRDKLDVTEPIGYLLEDVIKMTDKELTTAGNAKQATLSVRGTNPKVLYFVANGRSHTSLDDYELGVTDTLSFIKKQTTSLGTGLLKAPLLMTGRYTFKTTGAGADAVIDLTGPHAVTLDRRVARFDIINDDKGSSFTINEIIIKNTRPGAYLFAYADTLADQALAAGTPANFPAYAEPVIADLMPLDFLQFPTANMGTTPSAFYVYPSEVDGETFFHLSGLSNTSGSPMVQPVKMQLKQTGTLEETAFLPINPNTRYIINILDAGTATIDATLTVKEWLVGQGVDVEAGFGWLKLALEAPIVDVTITESKLLEVPFGATAAFNIAVTADTEWEIVDPTLIPWITLDPAKLPVAGTVGKSFSIATAANPSSEVRKAVLYIRNVKRPSVVQALTVEQAANAGGFKVTGDRLENNTLMATAAGGVTTLTLTGATDFSCTTADSWITLAQPVVTRADVTTSITGSKVQVTLAANDVKVDGKAVERVGIFSITAGELTQIITVKQAPKNLGIIVVEAEGLANGQVTYPGAAKTGCSLLVRALTEWKVEAFDLDPLDAVTKNASTWITDGASIALTDKNTPKANYNGSYNFNLPANTSFDARKSQVTLSNTFDPKIKLELILIQKGKLETLTLAGGAEFAGDVLTLTADATTANELTATSDKSGGTLTALTTTGVPEWLEVAVSGEGNAQKIIVTPTKANTETTERTAVITVKMAGANDKRFTVKQAGAAALVVSLDVTGKDLQGTGLARTLAMTHGEFAAATYTVTPTNAEVGALSIVREDGKNWLSLNGAQIADDGTFTLSADANATGAERTATVTISLTGAANPTVITVTQDAAPVLSISDGTNTNISTYTFAADAAVDVVGTFTATATEGVTTGFDVEIETNDWLTLAKDNVATTGEFTITCTGGPNTGTEARTATVTVKVAGAADKTFTVTQAAQTIP